MYRLLTIPYFHRDYDGLKRQLKSGMNADGGFTEQKEAAFVETLERELEKVTIIF